MLSINRITYVLLCIRDSIFVKTSATQVSAGGFFTSKWQLLTLSQSDTKLLSNFIFKSTRAIRTFKRLFSCIYGAAFRVSRLPVVRQNANAVPHRDLFYTCDIGICRRVRRAIEWLCRYKTHKIKISKIKGEIFILFSLLLFFID